MVKNPERRRRLVINSPLQSRIVLSISWPIVACIAATAVLLVWFTERLATQAFETGVALPGVTPLLVTVLAFLGVAIAYLIWHFIKVSNQVVGPMYRIQRSLEEFRNGKTDLRIRLRDGDFLSETADHINVFLDWVESLQPAATATDEATDTDEAEGPQGKVTTQTTEPTVDEPEEQRTH